MLADNHEPSEVISLLQQALSVEVVPLNEQGHADYLWQGIGGQQQAERKTWNDLLSNLDSVEDLLRRQMAAHPETRLMLVVEGIATPSMLGTDVWTPTHGKARLMVPRKNFHLPIQTVYAWLYQVEKFIEVYQTPNIFATARLLTSFYRADQKEDHSTFERYLKTASFHPNPQVAKLMSVGDGIGPTRAQALINRFGTVWGVLKATPGELSEVEGMGLNTARKLLRQVGRPDV